MDCDDFKQVMRKVSDKLAGQRDLYANPFGEFSEHVEVDIDGKKPVDSKTFSLEDHTAKGCRTVLTYGIGPAEGREYVTLIQKPVFPDDCMCPTKPENVDSKHSRTFDEAVQFHYDALNYLNKKGF